MELFKHILHLDFDWLFQNYGVFIYAILFIVIFVETGLVAMPFLPGDSLLFTAGLFAHSGHLNLAYVLILLFIAAVLGDNANYWIGRKIGLKVFHLKFRGRVLVKEEYLNKTHAFYEKYGTKAIIMARFVPFVRTFAPFAAGVAEMNYKKFFGFDVLGGALWIGSLTIAGYLLGGVEFIRKHIDLVCLGIILISVLPVVFAALKNRK
ncbi:MAG TPA: VTT domain-containing protein [Bacteroidia bacterium]|jgi:membrane-associated protein|nr:VTT domain-containing protein [Bacteroidia bacterium]